MSWSIKRPDVSLRVARFAPDKPLAGLTDEQRAAHRERRAVECAIPTRPDGLISADGRFRWSAGWAQWVPLSEHTTYAASFPQHDGPAMLAKDNARSQMRCHCGWCATCFTLAQHMSDWQKAKRLSEL
jgi:hypothetical protein